MNTGWTLAIKNMAWTEDTENQVDFLIRTMGLEGNERILDLACGYGRHTLSFAKRGYPIVGIDFTEAYIDDAIQNAKKDRISAEFILSDIRDTDFHEEFDVVLNLADGAIGYLSSEEENMKIFDIIAEALKPGGKHFMDVCNAEHAELCFPKRTWLAGDKELSLSEFTWSKETRQMYYNGYQLPYGELTHKPIMGNSEPTRLYSFEELNTIFKERNMTIESSFSDYCGSDASPQQMQLMVYSRKHI